MINTGCGAAKGHEYKDIAKIMGINFKTAASCRQRFYHECPDCLFQVAPVRGRKLQLSADKIEKIVNATVHS
jgi:transposase